MTGKQAQREVQQLQKKQQATAEAKKDTHQNILAIMPELAKAKNTDEGQDGSVKEYIGLDDFSVQVSGMITGSPGVEPIQQRIDLNKMLIAPVPIEVVCPYLQNLGIHLLIVESYDLPQDPGGVSYQKFSINFRSETPKELRIV